MPYIATGGGGYAGTGGGGAPYMALIMCGGSCGRPVYGKPQGGGDGQFAGATGVVSVMRMRFAGSGAPCPSSSSRPRSDTVWLAVRMAWYTTSMVTGSSWIAPVMVFLFFLFARLEMPCVHR